MISLMLSVVTFKKAYHCVKDLLTALLFIRGLRFLVIALTGILWAAGIFWGQGWLLIIGLVIIGEEMYEMGLLSLIIKSGIDMEDGKRVFP